MKLEKKGQGKTRESPRQGNCAVTIEARFSLFLSLSLSWRANADSRDESLFIFAFHGVERLPSGRGTKRRSRERDVAVASLVKTRDPTESRTGRDTRVQGCQTTKTAKNEGKRCVPTR